jgi:hypothetical protein
MKTRLVKQYEAAVQEALRQAEGAHVKKNWTDLKVWLNRARDATECLARQEQLSTGRIRPFSSEAQYWDWQEANCCRCKKYTGQYGACEINYAISIAACSDGTVSAKIAKRMGYAISSAYCWDCPERGGDK